MSSRVAVFHRGRIQQVAEPETLYEEPQKEFVAKFIGDNNILRGRIRSIDSGVCDVETPGGMVKAFPVHPLRPGESAALAIRPERVGLSKPGLYSNEFDARIDDILFLGDHLRLRLDLCGNSSFIVKIPNIVGHGAVLEGDRIRVGWAVTDCPGTARQRAAAEPGGGTACMTDLGAVGLGPLSEGQHSGQPARLDQGWGGREEHPLHAEGVVS